MGRLADGGRRTPEWHGKILYARLLFGDDALVGGDVPPHQYERPQGFGVMILIEDPADAERMFDTLAHNGMVKMPLEETFWAVRYGVLVDQFGIRWEINCEQTQ